MIGKKRRTEFKLPYLGIDQYLNLSLLINDKGDFGVVLELENPVLQFSADPEGYITFHQLYNNVIKILGDGHVIQKQDIFSKKHYRPEDTDIFLQSKYNDHFEGREYTSHSTFLIITRKAGKGFYKYKEKEYSTFDNSLSKVIDLFARANIKVKVLGKIQIDKYVKRILSMNFSENEILLDNILAKDTEVQMGNKSVRSITLIDTDFVDLPTKVSTHLERNDKEALRGFPIDNMGFLFSVPDFQTIVYNQVLEIVPQIATQRKLELKRKRHVGFPDPANNLCVEDIDSLLDDIARHNQLLVKAHFNVIVCAENSKINSCTNYIGSSLFNQGINPSKSAYNQLELFRTALPCNTSELKEYDFYLTTTDAALCFFFSETMSKDEISNFQIRLTDRHGIPVKIDLADLPMQTNRINNRNKFVLGPSGSGKSFLMNALLEQYQMYNTHSAPKWLMDIVIVDTGHSYKGLCSYYNGVYITYSEENPISTNPFSISQSEFNIEKKDFLLTLISLLWKTAEGTINQVESDIILSTISSYYSNYFSGESQIKELSFNSFYDYALNRIPQIKESEKVPFDLDEFRFVLKKFYRGGEYETLLNKKMSNSLFSESFIVFEIDSIKEHKVLFPIVTLIIMDVFIQKMRFRTDQRKALVIEEAWKAIASPIMAGYILYLYKTVRKFWGEAIIVTQELGDIINNEVVKNSIINNSDTVILLDQSKFKDNYKEISNLLSISEHERKKIFTINQLDNTENRGRFKEVYIRRGATGEVYGVEVSIYQYLTYTTEKPEKAAVEIYVNYYGNYPTALDNMVRDFRDSNTSLQKFISTVNKLNIPIGHKNSKSA